MEANSAADAQPAKPVSYGALLRRNRSYRYLWGGLAISMTGDWFRMIALYDVVLQLTGTSASALGGVLIAQSLPMFVFGPLAGVVVDRLHRKTILIAADLIRAVLALGFLLLTSPERIWLAYVLSAVIMGVGTFFHPALLATIPNIVKHDELVAANALSSTTWAAILALGSALGGMVTATFGSQVAFGIDAATYIVSALCIATVAIPAPAAAAPGAERQPSHWQDFIGGLRYMGTRPHLRRLLSVKAWSAGVGGSIILLSTLFAEQVFRAGVVGMGLLYMVRGIGATCGPLVARYLVGEKPEAMYRAIGVAFVFMASLYVVFSRMPTLVTAAVALCLGAMAANVLWVFSSTLLQLSVPDGYRGRIFATDFALLTIVMTLSTFLTGWAMDHFAIGPRPITTLVGLVLFLPGLWWLWCVARGAGPPAVPVSQSQTGHEV